MGRGRLGPALDAFVVQTIQRILLGGHATTRRAVEAFVKAVLTPVAVTIRTKSDDRELELLNRRIKATVAMLADRTFDGLDELHTTLVDPKARRDALATRLKPVHQLAMPAITEDELGRWHWRSSPASRTSPRSHRSICAAPSWSRRSCSGSRSIRKRKPET